MVGGRRVNPINRMSGGWAPGSSGVPYDATANEEYWGLVDINRKKKEAFWVVKSFYDSSIHSEE
jgi:hypothetical protein